MTEFENARQLESWLRSQRIDVDAWGRGGSKTVATLWAELQRGESELQEAPIRRLVSVVRVIIRRGNRVLVEVAQELDDGRRRYRLQAPSEKLRPGEKPAAAAIRCLEEELGVAARDVRLDRGSTRQWQRERQSVSYPGLCTSYRFFSVEANVRGLPDRPFSTREKEPGPGEPVHRHFWEWIPATDILEASR
jgi:8-oxo-dGTP pyrophosphatase MutT (NUDIX family)